MKRTPLKGSGKPIKGSNKPLKKTRGTIKKVTDKKKEEKKETALLREVYFDYHLNYCSYSEESGKSIPNPTRANICHIYDKGRHSSLQDNLDNYVYLTLEEHQDFDRLLYNHEFERLEVEFKNSWPKACLRIKKLVSLCSENTVFSRKINQYLDGK